jgi:hypothetical protein
MGRLKSALLAAAALCVVGGAPAFAQQPPDRGDTPGLGYGAGGSQGRGAPGPLAGVGLPFLIIIGAAGAYKLIRRRREESRSQFGKMEG